VIAGPGVADAVPASVGATPLGDADAISPTRPLSAASKALGSEEVEALAVALAEADADADVDVDAEADALTDGVADIDAEALAVALAVAVAVGDAAGVADDDVLADAEVDTLGVIVSDGDALAEGDAPSIGSTMQGSRGSVTCSEDGVDVCAAMAAELVPKVAKIRLAETVMATPPERRRPRLRA
jgi:hypothetical protein